MTLDATTGNDLQKDGSFVRSLRIEYFRRLFHPITIVACISCSLLFAFIGPYNTYDSETFLFRLTFWGGVVVSSCVLAIFFGVWANLYYKHKPFWFHSAIGASLFSVVYFVFMWKLLNVLFVGAVIPHPVELFAVIVAISALVYVCMWCFTVMLENRVADLTSNAPIKESAPFQSAPQLRKTIDRRNLWLEYKARLLDPINLATCALGSLLFAIIGPYETYQTDSFLFRLFFWSALVWSTSVITLLFAVWANLRFATRPFWFQSVVGSTVFSTLYLFLIWVSLRAIYPPLSNPGDIQFYFVTVTITSFLYFSMWCFAFMIETRIVNQLSIAKKPHATPPARDQNLADPASSGADQKTEYCNAAFLARLGPNAGTRLIRLAMSDHYIEAHT